MLETMMHVLEALQYAGEAPSALSVQIHSGNKQHAAYLGTLTSILGQGRGVEGEVYRWHEWRQGELLIVLHEPHSAEEVG